METCHENVIPTNFILLLGAVTDFRSRSYVYSMANVGKTDLIVEIFSFQIISVTGYEGKDRETLKNMIYVIGAKYTGYLSRSVTHLICNKYAFCEVQEFFMSSRLMLPVERNLTMRSSLIGPFRLHLNYPRLRPCCLEWIVCIGHQFSVLHRGNGPIKCKLRRPFTFAR